MSDSDKRSAAQHIRGRNGDASAFEEARPRSREDIMLDVRLRTGDRQAFSYAYLVRIEFQAGDRLRLFFGSHCVEVNGRRLDRLYATLIEHRTRFIQEGLDCESDLVPEGEPFVETITIKEHES